MVRIKRNQRRKRKQTPNQTNKTKSINTDPIPKHSSRVLIKNFEIFVTDFLTDPCGLPTELKDCVFIDEKTFFNPTSDIKSSNDSPVLKNIFGNKDEIDRVINSTVSSLANDDSKIAK